MEQTKNICKDPMDCGSWDTCLHENRVLNPQKQTEWSRVGVGMIVIHPSTGNILMGKRLSPYGYGTWNNPGGKLEFGEDPEWCALRETFEETNIKVKGIIRHCSYLNDQEVYGDNKLRHWVTLMFAGVARNPKELQNKEPTKHSEWRWFNPWELPNDTWEPMKKWWLKDQGLALKYQIHFMWGNGK